MSNYTLEYTEQVEGFTIKLYTTPEYDFPDWDLPPSELEQVINDINRGKLIYFIAKVVAEKLDIELASDCLGSCCYKNIQEFIADPYYKDMVTTVINEAKQKIQQLKKLS